MISADVNKDRKLPMLFKKICCHHCGHDITVPKNVKLKTRICSKQTCKRVVIVSKCKVINYF